MRRTLFCLGMVALAAGCAGTPRLSEDLVPETIRYTVEKIAPGDVNEAPTLFVIQARFEIGDEVLNQPSLTILPSQWGTITVGNFVPCLALKDSLEENEEPGFQEVQSLESGLYLAVRCLEGSGDGIETRVRAYWIRGGQIVWSRREDVVVASGEERVL